MQNSGNSKFAEPKAVLEVLSWKRKVSADIERLGYDAFHKQSEKRHHDLFERIERARQAKVRKAA